MLGARLVFGLLWFPGLLNAQKAGRPCQPPKLDDGYFVPQQTTYLHEEQISYACEKGHKRVLGGWWATSKCLDGNWSHIPQCINENNCGPPTILNGKYNKDTMGWYEEGDVIRVTCDPGREHQDRVATAKCINWTEVPKCIKTSGQAGGEGGATETGGKPGTSPGTAPGTSTTPGGSPSGSTSIKDQYVTSKQPFVIFQ